MRTCAYAACGRGIEGIHRSALYCSDACQRQRANQLKRDRYHGVVDAPPPRTYSTRCATRKAPKRTDVAEPCQGCAHAKPNPHAWRGIECAASLYNACGPLGPEGPKMKKEAV